MAALQLSTVLAIICCTLLCGVASAAQLRPHSSEGGYPHHGPHQRAHRMRSHHHRSASSNGLSRRSLATTSLCANVTAGAPAPFSAAPETCTALHTGPGAPIQVPADTATVKYGQVVGSGPYSVYDRYGKGHPLGPKAQAPANASEVVAVWGKVVVKATLDANSGSVVSYQPVLYVPSSAVLHSYVGSQYEGTLTNSEPPKGVKATAWIRWSFLKDTSAAAGSLVGTFDNLYRAVRDAKGVCQPALCADPKRKSAACLHYAKLFNGTVSLVWDPTVFFPGVSGSQLGAWLGPTSYVPTAIPALYGLLQPFTFVPKNFVGFNEGNPFKLPFQFAGAFAHTNASKVVYC